MSLKIVRLFIALLLVSTCLATTCVNSAEAITLSYNDSASTKPFVNLQCNKNSQIDFNFGQAATGSLNAVQVDTTLPYYNFTSTTGSTLQFLDRTGVNQSYSLWGYSFTTESNGRVRLTGWTSNSNAVAPDYEFSLRYVNQDQTADVIVSIPIVNYLGATTKQTNNVIRSGQGVSSYPILSSFYTLLQGVSTDPTNITNIASLSFLNYVDLGNFYTTFDNSAGTACQHVTYLINGFIYELPSAQSTSLTSTLGFGAGTTVNSANQNQFADRLCWASQWNSLIFETHLRESYPLWTAWFGIAIFWVSLLFGEANSL
jgi:hypothetical protein